MRTIVVYRGSWVRGKYLGYLLDKDNNMCVLGQVAVQMGVAVKSLKNKQLLGELRRKDRALMSALVVSEVTDRVLIVNDDPYLVDSKRESRLGELFENFDIELQFVDGVAPWFATDDA